MLAYTTRQWGTNVNPVFLTMESSEWHLMLYKYSQKHHEPIFILINAHTEVGFGHV